MIRIGQRLPRSPDNAWRGVARRGDRWHAVTSVAELGPGRGNGTAPTVTPCVGSAGRRGSPRGTAAVEGDAMRWVPHQGPVSDRSLVRSCGQDGFWRRTRTSLIVAFGSRPRPPRPGCPRPYRGDAARRRSSRGDFGGDGRVPGLRRGVHRGVRRQHPTQGPERVDPGTVDRPRAQRRAETGPGGPTSVDPRPARSRRPALPTARELRGRERGPDRGAGHDQSRPVVGWWAGRRRRRDAVRGPGPHRGRLGEPEVFRPSGA